MCNLISKINKSQFLVQFVKQCNVLSVVFNKLFKVVVVKLIKCAFIHSLVFANFHFTNSIQSICVAFFICVLAIQVEIVHMHSTNSVICFAHLAKLFIFSTLGQLSPQTKTSCVILAQHTLDSVDSVRNIIAFTVPTTVNISILNQIKERFKHIAFALFGVWKQYTFFTPTTFTHSVCFIKVHTFGWHCNCNQHIKPLQMHCNCSDRHKRIFYWSKASVWIKVCLDIPKRHVQLWCILVQIVFTQTLEYWIYVRLKHFLAFVYSKFFAEVFCVLTYYTLQLISKDTFVFATWIFIVKCVFCLILIIKTLTILAFYTTNNIGVSIKKCIYVWHGVSLLFIILYFLRLSTVLPVQLLCLLQQ